jgi:hypothetical protein
MAKLFENSIGDLEYLLLGLTFLGVMYLVMKQANYTIKLQRSGMNIGPGMAAWAAETTQGYPTTGRSGFSNGSNEPPVWNSTPFDPTMYDQAGSVGTGSVDFTDNLAGAGGSVQFSNWSNNTTGVREVSRVPGANNTTLITYSNGFSSVTDNKDGTVIAQYDSTGKLVSGARVFTQATEGLTARPVVGFAQRDGMSNSLDRALAGYGVNL